MARFQTCPKCRALLKPGTKTCPYCDANQASARAPTPVQDSAATSRVGLWLVGACVVLYILMIVLDPGRADKDDGALFEASHIGKLTFGMHHGFMVRHCGQYWRLVTANFVHLDMLHLVMNCAALVMVVAMAAGTLGAHRTWVIFITTGVLSMTASSLYGYSGAGASGGLCGMIGALGVYGFRRGGFEGRMLQRRMLTWAALILVVGFIPGLHIDNVAHGVGLLTGAGIGWLASAARAWGGRADRIWRGAGVLLLAMTVVVAVGFLAPNVWRGRERHEVKVYNGSVQRAMEALVRAQHGVADVDRLPEPLGEAPAAGDEVRATVNLALEMARNGAPVAKLVPAVRKADGAWRDWQARLICSHAVEFTGP